MNSSKQNRKLRKWKIKREKSSLTEGQDLGQGQDPGQGQDQDRILDLGHQGDDLHLLHQGEEDTTVEVSQGQGQDQGNLSYY